MNVLVALIGIALYVISFIAALEYLKRRAELLTFLEVMLFVWSFVGIGMLGGVIYIVIFR